MQNRPVTRRRKTPRGKKRAYAWLFFALLLAGGTVAVTLYIFFLSPHREKRLSPAPLHQEQRPATPSPENRRNRKAVIVIDDMGYNQIIDSALLDLDLSLSFAFLPYGPHTGKLSLQAKAKGRDILLHLPMEPLDNQYDPGPGTLTVAMTAGQLSDHFTKALARVPMATGVNNHMGSRLTADGAAITEVLRAVSKKGLFFLDSMTTKDSKAYGIGRQLGMPVLRRDIFLDHEPKEKTIATQLDRLIAAAQNGQNPVAIGHPRPQTLAALQQYLPRLRQEVEIVGIHELLSAKK